MLQKYSPAPASGRRLCWHSDACPRAGEAGGEEWQEELAGSQQQ